MKKYSMNRNNSMGDLSGYDEPAINTVFPAKANP